MSKMSELDLNIRELLVEGNSSVQISRELNLPLYMVCEFIEQMEMDEDLNPHESVNQCS